MEALHTIFPVFEANQILDQIELNNAFGYLEQQDRLSRKYLTGIGIVSGLELTFKDNTVTISCGTAITSLGYQITVEQQTFACYQEIELAKEFLDPVIGTTDEDKYLRDIFKYVTAYKTIKNCIELVSPDNTNTKIKPISDKSFFDNKAVVLLLELNLIHEKECDPYTCDDKGKNIFFKVRPLVIPESEVSKISFNSIDATIGHSKLTFPRFNVPNKALITANDIHVEFGKILNSEYLNLLTSSINSILNAINSPASVTYLTENKNINSRIITSNRINSQYVWDWIFNITDAYNEIIDFNHLEVALNCENENWFPFHVILGKLPHRTPFIPTGNDFHIVKSHLNLIVERLVHIINNFEVPKTQKIKITPSKLGNIPLSKKSIPFYYKNIKELNGVWSPELNKKGRNNQILAYDADQYSNLDNVVNPLKYDIEDYNFFRIEGHLGQPYVEAIAEIKKQKENFNLPFHISTYNALNYSNQVIDISKFEGSWPDLESEYDIYIKKITETVSSHLLWIKNNKAKIGADPNLDTYITFLEKIIEKPFMPQVFNQFLKIESQLNEVSEAIFLKNSEFSNLFSSLPDKEQLYTENFLNKVEEVNALFIGHILKVLSEKAKLRWKSAYSDIFFSTFVEKNKGFEHKAGVVKGGTFVVVYVDSKIFEPIKNDDIGTLGQRVTSIGDLISKFNNIDTSRVNPQQSAKVPNPQELHDIQDSNSDILVNPISPETTIGNTGITNQHLNQAELRASAEPSFVVSTTNNLNIPLRQSLNTNNAKIKNIGTQVVSFDTDTSNIKEIESLKLSGLKFNNDEVVLTASSLNDLLKITKTIQDKINIDLVPLLKPQPYEGLIIADFYLPYICCGEGNSIQINIEKNQELLISLEKSNFCQNDKGQYEIKLIGKDGGTWEGTDKVITIEGKYYINPSTFSIGSYTITYVRFGDKSNEINFEISEPKAINWKAERSKESLSTFFFTNIIQEVPELVYNWEVAGTLGDFSQSKSITFDFKKSTSYNVIITRKDDVCQTPQTITVKIAGDFDEMDFNTDDFFTEA